MNLFARTIRLSESTRRNLYMAPGLLLIATALIADACSASRNARAVQDPSEMKAQTMVAAQPSMEREAALRVE
jgi:hypothetical protein